MSLVAPASLVAFATLSLAAAALSGTTITLGQGGQGGAKEKDFTHASHVSVAWLTKDEVWRDCRACHDYSGDREDPPVIGDPIGTCGQCHFRGGFESGGQEDFEKDLGPLRERVRIAGFYHSDHLDMQCKSCHLPATQGEARKPKSKRARFGAGNDPGRIPAKLPIPRGFASCNACHDPTPGSEQREMPAFEGGEVSEAQVLNERLVGALNGSAPMQPGSLGPFLHTEHMTDTDEAFALDLMREADAGARDCGGCHQPAFAWAGATAPVPAEYTLDGCGTCHVSDAARTALAFETMERPGSVSEALDTFDHATHLRGSAPDSTIASGRAYASIESSGCLACHSHEYSDVLETYIVDGPLLGDERLEPFTSKYEGCAECHDGWKVPIHEDWGRETEAPAADRSAKPGACLACHVFGQGSDDEPTRLDTARARADVVRRRPSSFDVVSQAHPHVTGGAQEAACIECHLATDVESLPSRVVNQRFNHATHLPENIEPRHCIECHGATIAKTAGSGDIGRVIYPLLNADRLRQEKPSYGPRVVYADDDPRHGLSYDPSSCSGCHVGAELVPNFDEAPTAKSVFAFPHDLHQQYTCGECHIPSQDANTPVDIGTKPGALQCTQCHDHDEHWQVTGLIVDADVQKCNTCHVDTTGRIPGAAEEPYPVRRTGIARVDGATFHPPGAACDECHIAGPWSRWTDSELGAAAFVTGFLGPGAHHPGADMEGEEGRPRQPRGECLDCHWARMVQSMDVNPSSTAVRDEFGAQRSVGERSYPGWRGRKE